MQTYVGRIEDVTPADARTRFRVERRGGGAGRFAARKLILQTLRGGCFLLALWLAAPLWAQNETEKDPLDEFLTRLGLVDIHIVHLEKSLDAATGDSERREIAQRLADRYAERLITTAEDQARYDDVQRRIAALLNRVPEANTPSLRVMLLQADYGRAETLLNKWIDDPRETGALDDARKILKTIAPQLYQHQQDLSRKLQDVQGEIDRNDERDLMTARGQEARRLAEFSGRAAFFSGWSNYYYGLSKQDLSQAKRELAMALSGFRMILGIDEKEPYDEIEADWLALENQNRALALVGLGLVEAALGHLEESRRCFELLKHVSVPPVLRDHAGYWFLRGLLNANNLPEAVKFAASTVAELAGAATRGKVVLCATMVRAGFAQQSQASADRKRLGELGIQGLARLGAFNEIQQLMADLEIQLPEKEGGFYLTWIKGQQQFAAAENKQPKNIDDYELAANTLSAALKDPVASQDVPSATQCRYSLAWCKFRLKEYEDAAVGFQQTVPILKQFDSAKAANALYLAFHAYWELAKNAKPGYRDDARKVLEQLLKEFPDSDPAKKAEDYLHELNSSGQSAENSIRTLSSVKPGTRRYLPSQFKLAQLYYNQWREATDATTKAETKVNVLETVDRYLRAARRDSDSARKLKTALLGVDVIVRSKPTPTEISRAESLLNQVQDAAEAVTPADLSVAEYHYQRYQIARKGGKSDEARKYARWLVENARGSVYEESALITTAIAIDGQVREASGSERERLSNQAIQIYGRLVELAGDRPSVIQQKKNARAALSRYAHYLQEMDRPEEAAAQLDKLVAAFPTDPGYLRRAGLAHYAAGDYVESLQLWRKLLSGLPKNTAEFFEAKYYQILCLRQTDPAGAPSVYRQFRNLYRNINVDPWRQKFEDLDRRFSK